MGYGVSAKGFIEEDVGQFYFLLFNAHRYHSDTVQVLRLMHDLSKSLFKNMFSQAKI